MDRNMNHTILLFLLNSQWVCFLFFHCQSFYSYRLKNIIRKNKKKTTVLILVCTILHIHTFLQFVLLKGILAVFVKSRFPSFFKDINLQSSIRYIVS